MVQEKTILIFQRCPRLHSVRQEYPRAVTTPSGMLDNELPQQNPQKKATRAQLFQGTGFLQQWAGKILLTSTFLRAY